MNLSDLLNSQLTTEMNLSDLLLPFAVKALLKSLKRPIIIGISGVQGSGKTTVCAQLEKELNRLGKSCLSLSIDDLYLTFQDQQELFNQTHNPLFEWRGNPGTHDLSLEILSCLKNSEKNENIILIPRYDKSRNQGRGDRLPKDQWNSVSAKVDVVLFEGWCLGFKSLPLDKLHEKASPSLLSRWNCSMANLEEVNKNLLLYEKEWYPFLDYFVQIKPLDIKYVFDWRLEQEETLKKEKGATVGLAKDQVFEFVNRFMPVYTLYLDRLSTNGFFEDESNRFLQVEIDTHRKVVSSHFL